MTKRSWANKSKLEYIKEIAYFNQELDHLGGDQIMKESNRRFITRELKERAKEERRKELQELGEEIDEDVEEDKSEKSFDKKKDVFRERIGKKTEHVLLPPLINSHNGGKRDAVVIEK